MEYKKFTALTKNTKPSTELKGVYLALWYAKKDDWDMAHAIIQDINTDFASWIHAYLHRVEGDTDNADYWYNRARKQPFYGSFKSELDNIIKSIFNCYDKYIN